MLSTLPLFICFLPLCNALKILSYNPVYGRSHLTFMHSLHEALIDAGHQVYSITPIIDGRLERESTRATEIVIPQSPYSISFESKFEEEMVREVWISDRLIDALASVSRQVASWQAQCNFTLSFPGLLEQLEKEKFDAALSEPLCVCGFGIFEKLQIKNVAVVVSTASTEGFFGFTGAPSYPSYVPGQIGRYSDRMTFSERLRNGFGAAMIYLFGSQMQGPFDSMFQNAYGPDFPTTSQMLAKSSFVFVNSEPLIDFPRVITHKIIDIGGITLASGHKAINETWSSILDLRPKTVLISFGSVAKSKFMPENYKAVIKQTIQKFPDVTFFWKYERPEDKVSEGIANLIESTWVPQNDILRKRQLNIRNGLATTVGKYTSK
ncbi:hypothetical protein PMAYCL1PPCAC_28773 [Pristionchus mayeri]|uniref:glucuronosyltransferase n=1 Tax=Pristionchus mayeri TaxID=1317129 RepID=A0AAN5D849_9BILA|nr:hypothetical protein PMAYCL1PPCAC_28773 [Pristionchus mayeri]